MLSARKLGTKRSAVVSIKAYSHGRWNFVTSAWAISCMRVAASMHKKAMVITSMRRPPTSAISSGEPNRSCKSTISPVNTARPPIAAIVMRSCLMERSSASSSTKMVATAITGKINTHAVTATVTIICVNADIFMPAALLSC